MLTPEMEKRLNQQLHFELVSAYHYFSMSAFFDSRDLVGFATWMRQQAKEELMHMSKFFDYINDRDGRVELLEVAKPRQTWESPLEAMEDAYAHECKVSEKISELVGVSIQQNDHMTNAFLQWFVTEQVEEEATVRNIVQQMKLAGGNGQGLFMLDRELGSRGDFAPSEG